MTRTPDPAREGASLAHDSGPHRDPQVTAADAVPPCAPGDEDQIADLRALMHNHRQRARERFLRAGPDALSDTDLLELLLFASIERVDVKPLAKQLLAEFQGLGAVLAAEPARLLKHKRINERTVTLFRLVREMSRRLAQVELREAPILSSSQALLDYCRVAMAHDPVEQFRVLFLNKKNMLLADEVHQRGTVDETPVYTREVLKRALEIGATALILVHNHPSGDPTPSSADIAMTKALAEAAQILTIAVHDHLIIGRHGSTSLRALGVL